MSPLWSIFFPPRYVHYLILISKEAKPLWDYEVWTKVVAPILDRHLFAKLQEPPSVHSRQTIRNRDIGIRFGRLRWSEKGHRKWCHNSPETSGRCDNWYFVDTEIFWPSRSVLIRDDDLPQVYVQLRGHLLGVAEPRALYDSSFHLVVRRSFAQAQGVDVKAIAIELSRGIDVVAVYRSESRVGSLNVFESLSREDVIYAGIGRDPLPNPQRMRGKWERVDGDSSSNGEAKGHGSKP